MIKILTGIYFAALFYSIGALTIENDVNYATWALIDAKDFSHYHSHLESLLRIYMFTPISLTLLLNIILVFSKQLSGYRIYALGSLLVLGFIVVYSLAVEVPLHRELQEHYNERTLQNLISNHKMIRLPATMLLFAVNLLWLVKQRQQRGD